MPEQAPRPAPAPTPEEAPQAPETPESGPEPEAIVDPAAAVIVDDADVVAPEPAPKPKPKPLRPSDLAPLIAERAREQNLDPKLVDVHKLLKDKGLPNPTRLFGVKGTRHGSKGKGIVEKPSLAIEAVDSGAAIQAYIVASGIPQGDVNAWHFETFIRAE